MYPLKNIIFDNRGASLLQGVRVQPVCAPGVVERYNWGRRPFLWMAAFGPSKQLRSLVSASCSRNDCGAHHCGKRWPSKAFQASGQLLAFG